VKPIQLSGHARLQLLFRRVDEEEVNEAIRTNNWLADYGAEGHLAGIKILDVIKRLGDRDTFYQFTLEDVVLTHN
jgi:hypothetical protein